MPSQCPATDLCSSEECHQLSLQAKWGPLKSPGENGEMIEMWQLRSWPEFSPRAYLPSVSRKSKICISETWLLACRLISLGESESQKKTIRTEERSPCDIWKVNSKNSEILRASCGRETASTLQPVVAWCCVNSIDFWALKHGVFMPKKGHFEHRGAGSNTGAGVHS